MSMERSANQKPRDINERMPEAVDLRIEYNQSIGSAERIPNVIISVEPDKPPPRRFYFKGPPLESCRSLFDGFAAIDLRHLQSVSPTKQASRSNGGALEVRKPAARIVQKAFASLGFKLFDQKRSIDPIHQQVLALAVEEQGSNTAQSSFPHRLERAELVAALPA
ncbi:MAG: hypothetical protein QNJ35_16475 [Paracoccaceae bacterium]|nr:hypothetical protein [Paracoccaceae bacterium]